MIYEKWENGVLLSTIKNPDIRKYGKMKGYLPVVWPTLKDFQWYGQRQFFEDRIEYEVLQPTPEELRVKISAQIRNIAESYISQLSIGYNNAETSRWEQDREAVKSSNWSRFEGRKGSYLTAQQYAESRVLPKMQAGEAFLDMIIGKRTDLLIDLENTADEDLINFDYKTTWDGVEDFEPPPLGEVTQSWRDNFIAFLNTIAWWK